MAAVQRRVLTISFDIQIFRLPVPKSHGPQRWEFALAPIWGGRFHEMVPFTRNELECMVEVLGDFKKKPTTDGQSRALLSTTDNIELVGFDFIDDLEYGSNPDWMLRIQAWDTDRSGTRLSPPNRQIPFPVEGRYVFYNLLRNVICES